MQIRFDIDGIRARFDRNWMTGEASLTVGDERTQLQSFWKALFNLEFETTRYWQCDVSSHSIVIEKIRPALFPGFRPQTYKILVDGDIAAEAHGY
jgi:hypothetical protein